MDGCGEEQTGAFDDGRAMAREGKEAGGKSKAAAYGGTTRKA